MTPSARTFSGVNSKYFQGSIQPWSKGSSEPGFYTLDERDNLRLYAIDRISNICILDERFKRDESINPDNLFKHSYGIWDDPSIPIDEVELSYSPLDGKFIKTTPLHSSQEILVDNEEEFRIRLHIRITNDFVMALLARSSSLTVIRPSSLRRRIYDIYRNALKRNEL